MTIICESVEQPGWLALREQLWPESSLENLASQAMHVALGFEETERVVFFRKALP